MNGCRKGSVDKHMMYTSQWECLRPKQLWMNFHQNVYLQSSQISSLASVQSIFPSQKKLLSIHCPFSHCISPLLGPVENTDIIREWIRLWIFFFFFFCPVAQLWCTYYVACDTRQKEKEHFKGYCSPKQTLACTFCALSQNYQAVHELLIQTIFGLFWSTTLKTAWPAKIWMPFLTSLDNLL